MIKSWISLSIFLLLGCSGPQVAGFDVRKASPNSIEIDSGAKRSTVLLNHRVDAFEVKCDKSIIVLWGEAPPLKKPGSIPFNGVTVVNLADGRKVSNFTLSRGPFEVKFARDGSAILIDESLFDVKSRKMTDLASDSIDDSLLDQCPDFKGKFYGRIDSATGRIVPNPS